MFFLLLAEGVQSSARGTALANLRLYVLFAFRGQLHGSKRQPSVNRRWQG
jgi:hypothetical protein